MRERAGGTLDLVFSKQFLVESQLVRVVNDVTETLPFDSEGVSVETGGGQFFRYIEAFGADYEGHNDDCVLFTDSPCTRRWEDLTVNPGIDDAGISDEVCNTPISGRDAPFCPGGPPPGGVAEALYVIDLVVASSATLVAGDPLRPVPVNINIYYTGTLTPDPPVPGSIVDAAGNDYAPIRLKPTLYGDFNGNGNGDEPDEVGSDTRRFNDAFCTCIGQPNYDILVDWNCDGVIDNLDRDQYNANWNNPGAITTSPCSSDPCN